MDSEYELRTIANNEQRKSGDWYLFVLVIYINTIKNERVNKTHYMQNVKQNLNKSCFFLFFDFQYAFLFKFKTGYIPKYLLITYLLNSSQNIHIYSKTFNF